MGKKLELKKTADAIVDVFDKSIKPLYIAFIEACRKFPKFYLKSEYSILVNNNDDSPLKTDHLANVNLILKNETSAVVLHYVYVGFNRSGFGDFDYTSNIIFQFKNGNYVVSTPIRSIENLYEIQLTAEK